MVRFVKNVPGKYDLPINEPVGFFFYPFFYPFVGRNGNNANTTDPRRSQIRRFLVFISVEETDREKKRPVR